MTEVQVIVQGGKPAFYVVPAELWKMSGRAEDIADAEAFDRAVAADDGVRFPQEVAHAIADGAHAVRAWREYRGLSQDALAGFVGSAARRRAGFRLAQCCRAPECA